MIRFAADENFNWNVVRGIRQQDPSVDILTIQDAGMRGALDEDVLVWAANEGRVLLSHDANTMKAEAEARMRDGRSMCGLILCAVHAHKSMHRRDYRHLHVRGRRTMGQPHRFPATGMRLANN